MRRLGLFLLLAGAGAAGLLAAATLASTPPPPPATTDGATTVTDTTATEPPPATTEPVPPATTEPAPPPVKPKPRKPVRLAPGVTVGGIHVGSLAPAAAEQVVRTAFRAPLELTLGRETLRVTPTRLGAVAYVKPAVARARTARPGAAVPLVVSVRGAAVRSYVDSLARRYDRAPIDAKVVLRKLRPVVVEGRVGIQVKRTEAVAEIVGALKLNRRRPLEVPVRMIPRKVGPASIGPVIVIRRESKWLYLYQGEKLVRRFRVATGQASYPTPLGRWKIVVMWRNPWWYPPSSAWARGKEPIPPGPGNPLGTRWMGLDAPAVGIHGTPDAASLGYSASHGCIRMAIPSAEWLFDHVKIGTPVFIVPA